MAIFTKTEYCTKYLLLHPWEWVMHKCRDIKCAWQRANKGYCFRDLWSIDEWFLNIMPQMLDELNEIRNGYPSNLTDEQWGEILGKMSKAFNNAHDEKTKFKNIYEDEYLNTLEMDIDNGQFKCSASDELKENYYAAEKLKENFMRKSLDDGLELFGKYFYALWD